MGKKKEIYILYLITKEKGKLLKIGITRKSNLNSRVFNIEKDFGKINYSKSYICYSKNMKDIDNLEKLLHKTFYKSRKPNRFKTGIGKTEWFEDHILVEVKNQIKFLKKKNKNYRELSILKKMSGEEKEYKVFFKFLNILTWVLNIAGFASLLYLAYYYIH